MKYFNIKSITPLKSSPQDAFIGFVGGVAAIYILLLLTKWSGNLFIMAPFGASCVLAFGVWDSPLSQPRNIVGGHIISSFVGIFFHRFFGSSMLLTAIAVGIAISLMILSKTTHPPAGADPLVILLGSSTVGWSYLLTPVLSGALVIVIVGLVVNNLAKGRKYPKFWL